MTTNELMTAWLDRCERERVKPRTYSRYKGLIVQHILPELGDTPIDDLGKRQISEFLTAHQADGNLRGEALSATSTNLMLTVLNGRIHLCMRYGITPDKSLRPHPACTRSAVAGGSVYTRGTAAIGRSHCGRGRQAVVRHSSLPLYRAADRRVTWIGMAGC